MYARNLIYESLNLPAMDGVWYVINGENARQSHCFAFSLSFEETSDAPIQISISFDISFLNAIDSTRNLETEGKKREKKLFILFKSIIHYILSYGKPSSTRTKSSVPISILAHLA